MDKFELLKNYFGYDSFREGQEVLIDAILQGRDVLGIMPTGAGKSICYQVPALLMPGVTVVVSPLISLMKDQVQALNQAGIHAAYINSSLTENQIRKALMYAAAGRYKLVYVAPERLETLEFIQFATQTEISMLTVDEAHCISQWGQDFRPSYLKIVQFIRRLSRRPVISAFTATATGIVREDISCVLGLRSPQVLVSGFDRENLYFAVEKPRRKERFVLGYIQDHGGDSGIIYCATRKNVEAVYEKLLECGVSVTRYHAGLDNEERKCNQEDFVYDRKQVMVATNAFGMGIDKSNVRYVIHYNMPQSMENYYQEAGRAGRDGEPSECILLYSDQDLMINRFLLESKEENPEFTLEEGAAIRQRDEERLGAMHRYCMTKQCLRQYILGYFGEYGEENCGNCGNCRREYEEQDVTLEAQKIIRCVLEMGQKYGVHVVTGTLSGQTRAKLREYGVSRYESFGSMEDWTESGIKELIHQMILEGVLVQTRDKYALLKVTALAREVLEGNRTVFQKKWKTEDENGIEQGEETAKPARSGSLRKSDILNSRGLELFETLRGLRMEIAREEAMPPYLVFSDKTLVELCVRLPFTQVEMLEVPGVGVNKYQKYGERFQKKIRDFVGDKKEKLYFGDGREETALSLAGSTVEKKRRREPKTPFMLPPELAARFPYREQYLFAELAAALSELRDPDRMKKLTGADIFRYLNGQGLLEERWENGVWRKVITEEGARAGLAYGMRTSKSGTEYEDVYCREETQRVVVEHYTDRNYRSK